MEKKLKGSRWTKIHASGEEALATEAQANVMNITVGENICQAEIIYSTSMVRNFEKVVYWMLRSLEVARATDAVAMAGDELRAKTAEADKSAEEITAHGDGWECDIKKLGNGVFKASMSWSVASDGQLTIEGLGEEKAPIASDPVPEKPKAKRNRKGGKKATKKEAEAPVETPVETPDVEVSAENLNAEAVV